MVSAIVQRSGPFAFDEDSILVERSLAGDRHAFQGLYERYHDKVFAIAKGVLGDQDDALDAVQEIFTLVYRKLRSFQQGSKFSTWLFRISVNASIQLARKNKYRQRLTTLTAADDRADESIEAELQDPRIQTAMMELAPQDRALLAMFYWDELSLNEIADSMSCSPNAAKTRLYRARERFREVYGEVDEA